jgi:hypothetical protein
MATSRIRVSNGVRFDSQFDSQRNSHGRLIQYCVDCVLHEMTSGGYGERGSVELRIRGSGVQIPQGAPNKAHLH